MIFFLLLLVFVVSSSAFVSKNNYLFAIPHRQKFQASNNNDFDLYVYSIDGTLASMTEYKSKIAIKAALEVWPSLHSVVEELGMHICTDDFADDSYAWLLNKLGALSSITQQGDSPDEMLGCDEGKSLIVLIVVFSVLLTNTHHKKYSPPSSPLDSQTRNGFVVISPFGRSPILKPPFSLALMFMVPKFPLPGGLR